MRVVSACEGVFKLSVFRWLLFVMAPRLLQPSLDTLLEARLLRRALPHLFAVAILWVMPSVFASGLLVRRAWEPWWRTCCRRQPFACRRSGVRLHAEESAVERRSRWRLGKDRRRVQWSQIHQGGQRSSKLPDVSKELQPCELTVGDVHVHLLIDPGRKVFAHAGAELWPSAWVLASYLEERLQSDDLLPVSSAHHPAPERLRVLELGAGCGAVGLWLARRCGMHVRVCLTDVPQALPLLRLNAQVAATENVDVEPLRWTSRADATKASGFGADLVIGSHLCYSHGVFPAVLNTLDTLAPRMGAILTMPDKSKKAKTVEMKRIAESRRWRWVPLQRQKCDPVWLQATEKFRTGRNVAYDYETVALLRLDQEKGQVIDTR
mmetsp:Transcript_86462/g.241988  ORF Transcript_86462/g.241988 Transcript_86462/m.241988 type:complete len:379 (-) Transcript_86462:137-1273(-)